MEQHQHANKTCTHIDARGCHKVKSLKGGVTQTQYEIIILFFSLQLELWGFHVSARLAEGGTPSLEKKKTRATLDAQRLRHELGLDSGVRRTVPADPLRAPQPKHEQNSLGRCRRD